MSDEKERARGFLEGYEAGMNEAWKEFQALCNKGYHTREIRVLAKSKMVNIQGRLDAERKRLEESLGESLEDPVDESDDLPLAELKPGGTYLVEGGVERGLEKIGSLITEGWQALCISRMKPGRVSELLNGEADIIWFTKTEVPDSEKSNLAEVDFRTLSPTSTDMLTTIMIDFLRKDGDKAVMFGGLDFLMTYNEFPNLLRMIQNMKDRIALTNSILLISYDPTLLEERDLRRLRSEIDERA